ncbi:MAG: substrate binding domain-containing protein [Alphaproteobacteria bacterium]
MTDRLVDLVEDRFDLAIRLGAQSDSSLIARKIGSGRRFVVASPAYLDRAGVPGTPAELADHNCLTFRSHRGSNLWRFRGGRGESQVRVTGSLFSDNGEVLCAAAVSGLGLILVPEWLTGSEVKQGRLRELLSGWRALPEVTPIYAVYPHQRHLPAKVRSFIDFLAQRFAAQSGWDGGT